MGVIGRAFVAVEPPAEVLAAVEERVRSIRAMADADRVRWSPEVGHATLQFLGRVDEPDEMVAVLDRAMRAVEPVLARLGGGGAFPRARRGTVLWLGFTEGAEALGRLAAAVAGATAQLGFAGEDRGFRPHVTLARTQPARDLRELVRAVGDTPVGPTWRVRDVVLLSSETRATGARYSEISRFRLGG